jgi:hypothetical protein
MNENENTAVVWDNRKPLTARGFSGFWYTGGTVAYFFFFFAVFAAALKSAALGAPALPGLRGFLPAALLARMFA